MLVLKHYGMIQEYPLYTLVLFEDFLDLQTLLAISSFSRPATAVIDEDLFYESFSIFWKQISMVLYGCLVWRKQINVQIVCVLLQLAEFIGYYLPNDDIIKRMVHSNMFSHVL